MVATPVLEKTQEGVDVDAVGLRWEIKCCVLSETGLTRKEIWLYLDYKVDSRADHLAHCS